MSGNSQNSVTGEQHYSILDTDINEVSKNIYLGDKRTAKNQLLLQGLGIKKIVVAGDELTAHYPKDFEYLHISVKDSLKENIEIYFQRVFEFIEQGLLRGEGVFVHCAFGISRSSTLVIAYLMKKLKISYRQAFAFVRRKRPEIKPNVNFQQQLKNWQSSLKR